MRYHFPKGTADERATVDIESRSKGAKILLRFYQGIITTDTFEDLYLGIKTEDPALKGIYYKIWGFYDDLWPHKLKGKRAIDSFGQQFFERCILFLKSDLKWSIRLDEEVITEPTELYKAKRRIYWMSLCVLIFVYLVLAATSAAWLIFGLFLIPLCLYLIERILLLYWKNKETDMRMHRYQAGKTYWPFENKEQYEHYAANTQKGAVNRQG